ncbi:hypothetical protein LZ31DRAFT_60680 [Colletotrichum somersetense]|nr:hypothetical protein LZ31DRAFT_60680 [Colletotrichum somersetense]
MSRRRDCWPGQFRTSSAAADGSALPRRHAVIVRLTRSTLATIVGGKVLARALCVCSGPADHRLFILVPMDEAYVLTTPSRSSNKATGQPLRAVPVGLHRPFVSVLNPQGQQANQPRQKAHLEPTSIKMTTMRDNARAGQRPSIPHHPSTSWRPAEPARRRGGDTDLGRGGEGRGRGEGSVGEEECWTSRRARRGGEFLVLGSPNYATSSAQSLCNLVPCQPLCRVLCPVLAGMYCVSVCVCVCDFLCLSTWDWWSPQRLHKVGTSTFPSLHHKPSSFFSPTTVD